MAKKTTDDTPEDILGNFLNATKDEHFNFIVDKLYTCSSGSLLLNQAMGGKVRSGVIRHVGISEGGKTSQALEDLRGFFSDNPQGKAFYIRAESKLGPEIQKRSGLKFVYNSAEWVAGTIYVHKTNVFENALSAIITLFKGHKDYPIFVIVDSVDGLIPRGDLDKGLDEAAKVAGGAGISTLFMKHCAPYITLYGHFLLLVSQVRAKPKINQYEKSDPTLTGNASGANALQHGADWILEFMNRRAADNIFDKEGKLVGHWARVIFRKSTNEITGTEVKYPIRHGRLGGSSIWVEKEIVDMLIVLCKVESKGAWITVSDELIASVKEAGLEIPQKINGEGKFTDHLEENPGLTKYLFDMISGIIN